MQIGLIIHQTQINAWDVVVGELALYSHGVTAITARGMMMPYIHKQFRVLHFVFLLHNNLMVLNASMVEIGLI